MAAPPYMKFFIADYLLDTADLTRAEHGSYMLLLMAMWRAGGKLPASDAKLARIAKCTPAEWEGCKASILTFFRRRGGALTHKRITADLAKYRDKSPPSAKTSTLDDPSLTLGCPLDDSENAKEISLQANPNRTEQNRDSPQPPKGGVSEARFREGWEAYPLPGRENVSDLVARAAWAAALPIAGSEERLVAAIRSRAAQFAANGGRLRRFDRWLANGEFIAHLPSADAPNRTWRGPPDLRAELVAIHGERWAEKWLDPCGWRDLPERALVTASPTAADRIGRDAGHLLAHLGVAIVLEQAA